MKREPLAIRALVVGAIYAILLLAITYGAPINEEQLAAWSAALTAVSFVVVVVWTRGKVTPVDDPRLPTTDGGSDGEQDQQ